MVAFECFEKRWDFPKAYHLFYDQFFKAAVGDRKWKESLDEDKPFGNSNTEAFALMLLKNNYHAWMSQAYTEFYFENQYNLENELRKRKEKEKEDALRKRIHNDGEEEEEEVVRDKEYYGDGVLQDRLQDDLTSIIDEMLPNFHYLRIEHKPKDTSSGNGKDVANGIHILANSATERLANSGHHDDQNSASNHEEYPPDTWTIVQTPDPSSDALYKKAAKYNELCLANSRYMIKDEEIKAHFSGIESLQSLDSNVESENTAHMNKKPKLSRKRRGTTSRTALLMGLDDDISDEAEGVDGEDIVSTPAQKRRKALKQMKCFTKKGDTRNTKQKGWSSDGYKYHEKLTREIMADEDYSKQFVDLYRQLSKKIEIKIAELANPMKKMKYVPDRDMVWQL